MENLTKIQLELKAPKNQYNKFGNYHYRSAEDILEAVKPLLSKYNAELTICDEICEIGDRIYVKAVCKYREGNDEVTVNAYAREPENKKGMDESQITGTASSYARKYALNGLFLIDDTKDADTNEYSKQSKGQPPVYENPLKTLNNLILQYNKLSSKPIPIENLCARYGVKTINELSAENLQNAINGMQEALSKLART